MDNLKEELNCNIIRIASESFESEISKEGVIVSGLALPFNKISRNGFTYTTESIKSSYKTLEGAPVLFNHDPNIVLGHVTEVFLSDTGMEYKIDLDSEESNIIRKIKRKDINKVSIQCIFDAEKSFVTEETGVTNAYINEFLELSIVTIPGFADTTAALVESFKSKRGIQMKNKSKEQEEPKPEDEKKTEQDPTPEDEKKTEQEEEDPIKKIAEIVDNLDKRVGAVEKWMTEQMGDEEPDKEVPADDSEKDKATEEAIKHDKRSISTEGLQKTQEVKITTKDLRKAFSEV